MTLKFRQAKPHDACLLPDIERSAGECFRVLPDLAWIADDDVMPVERHLAFIMCGTVWVVEGASSELLGFLTAESVEEDLHIWQLAVRHDWQGQGLGRRLVATAIDYAAAQLLSAVTLTTFRDVTWNAPFYARLGFEELAASALGPRLAGILAREADYGLPVERRCAMRLSVSGSVSAR